MKDEPPIAEHTTSEREEIELRVEYDCVTHQWTTEPTLVDGHLTDRRAADLLVQFLPQMALMNPEQRLRVLNAVNERYCSSCGKEEIPGSLPCQCNNDS